MSAPLARFVFVATSTIGQWPVAGSGAGAEAEAGSSLALTVSLGLWIGD